MKYVLEYGVRGGAHVDNLIIPTGKLAAQLAASLVLVLDGDALANSAQSSAWKLARNCPRKSWTSPTHFVALSKLDGVPRGAASAGLWRKSGHKSELNDRQIAEG